MLLPVEDLKVGMFVMLPVPWHEHPFLKNAFVISSPEEIEKLRALGLEEIEVDLSRSKISRQVAPRGPGTVPSAAEDSPGVASPVVPEELSAAIRNRYHAPEQRARLVVEHATVMMENLLESPTAPRIKEAKTAIGEIVRMIVEDENTTYYLVNLQEHDFTTYTHSVNVGVLGVTLAKNLFRGTKGHDLEALGVGFFLHDLGKTKIPSAIINKRGKLDDEEMRLIRRHPGEGYRILVETKQITEESRLIVLQHHERIDGTGYPRGLRGDEIHLYGRLCAIADVYDALTSERPYKKKLMPFEALKLMRDEMLHHFHADLFERFVHMFRAPRRAS